MDEELDAALGALERSAHHPADFSQTFVESFPISGAAISTLGAFFGNETLSASDIVAARLDELQFDLGEGPCWDAMNSAKPIFVDDLSQPNQTRWPAFVSAAADHPVRSLFAFPLVLGTVRIGAVDLYSTSRMQLDATESRRASTMASAVSSHVLRRALDELGVDIDDPGNAFSRRLVHQATGMVIAQLRQSPDDAKLVIQGHAFATERSMMEVAQDIVDRKLAFRHGDAGIEVAP